MVDNQSGETYLEIYEEIATKGGVITIPRPGGKLS